MNNLLNKTVYMVKDKRTEYYTEFYNLSEAVYFCLEQKDKGHVSSYIERKELLAERSPIEFLT